MSIYKTYRHIHAEGTINGVKYALEKYCTWYIPYKYAPVLETNLADHILVRTPKPLNSNVHTDQFGNEWYEKVNLGDSLFVAMKEGERLFTEPTSYFKACQVISKDAGLPFDGKHYETCYRYLRCVDEHFDSSKGEYVPDFENLIPHRFNVGDRVFRVVHKDSDTRNGERKQVESFIVKNVTFGGNHWEYDDGDPTCWRKSVNESQAFKSVEEIKEVHGDDIWMWHHLGGCRIEKCPSTEFFMKYLSQQED